MARGGASFYLQISPSNIFCLARLLFSRRKWGGEYYWYLLPIINIWSPPDLSTTILRNCVVNNFITMLQTRQIPILTGKLMTSCVITMTHVKCYITGPSGWAFTFSATFCLEYSRTFHSLLTRLGVGVNSTSTFWHCIRLMVIFVGFTIFNHFKGNFGVLLKLVLWDKPTDGSIYILRFICTLFNNNIST